MKKILLTVAVKLYKVTACRKRGNTEVKSMDSKLFESRFCYLWCYCVFLSKLLITLGSVSSSGKW